MYIYTPRLPFALFEYQSYVYTYVRIVHTREGTADVCYTHNKCGISSLSLLVWIWMVKYYDFAPLACLTQSSVAIGFFLWGDTPTLIHDVV